MNKKYAYVGLIMMLFLSVFFVTNNVFAVADPSPGTVPVVKGAVLVVRFQDDDKKMMYYMVPSADGSFVAHLTKPAKLALSESPFSLLVNVVDDNLNLSDVPIYVNSSSVPNGFMYSHMEPGGDHPSWLYNPEKEIEFADGSITSITATFSDDSGNTVPFLLNITVPDTIPPVLTLPSDMWISASGPSGATVSFTATATDTDPTNPTVTCTPASGSVFPLGLTTVSCSATDTAGNTATGSFKVTVGGARIGSERTTLNGGSSTTVKGGASVTATMVNTSVMSGEWASTSYQIQTTDEREIYPVGRDSICVDTPNHGVGTGYTESFPIIAPTAEGTYDVIFGFFGGEDCTDGPIILSELPNGLIVDNGDGGSQESQEPISQDLSSGGGGGRRVSTITLPTGGEVLGAATFQFIRTLRFGMVGDDVLELHKKLTELGFYKGPIDNQFGKLLLAAVKVFQKANPPLKVDGVVGPATRVLLNK